MNEPENVYDLICANREFDSKTIDESDSHVEKQPEQKISTLRGIKID
jgi:hypothetical protein